MAHLRARHALELFQALKTFSPIVGLFGHRQVGKTTFLEQVCGSYQTFDDRSTLDEARLNPSKFLTSLGAKPAGIDESQLCEDLFPALKEYVRKKKSPGQILLSGSVRFYSRQAIKESLTGRIVNLDMLPMVLTELCRQERSTLPLKLIQKTSFSDDLEDEMKKGLLATRTKELNAYLIHGGLPGICFLRNQRIRSERLRDQLQLMLDRDLRLVYPSSVPFTQIRDFASQLAMQEGEVFKSTTLRKLTGITEVTQKKLLQAFEAIFLLRLLSVEGDRRGVSVYFEDQAEHGYLHDGNADPLKSFEGLVYRNLRASFFYEMGLDFRFFQFRLRPDIRIPFAVRTQQGCLGIVPILTASPTRKDLRMAHAFLQRYSPGTVLFVTRGNPLTTVVEARILQIPAERLLFEE